MSLPNHLFASEASISLKYNEKAVTSNDTVGQVVVGMRRSCISWQGTGGFIASCTHLFTLLDERAMSSYSGITEKN